MKLVECNGKELVIYELGPVLMRFKMRNVPIKHNGARRVEDEEARRIARELIASGAYDRVAL